MTSKASLRISGSALSEEELNATLGVSATRFVARNIASSDGIQNDRCIWILEAPEKMDIEHQIQWIFENTSSEENVWTSLNQAYKVDLFCGFFLEDVSDGFEVSGSILKEAGKRGIKLGFDIYENEKAKAKYRAPLYLIIIFLLALLLCGAATTFWLWKKQQFDSLLRDETRYQSSDIDIYEAILISNHLSLSQFIKSTSQFSKEIHLPSNSNPNVFINTRALRFENDTLRGAGPMIYD